MLVRASQRRGIALGRIGFRLKNFLGCGDERVFQRVQMPLFSEIADDHHAQDAAAAGDSAGDPALAIARDFFHEARVSGGEFRLGEARVFETEVDDGELRIEYEFKLIGVPDPFGEEAREMELPIDEFFVGAAAVDLKSEPQFEGIHAPRPLRADLEVVDHGGAGDLGHVGSGDAKSVLKTSGFAGKDDAGCEGHGEPLVRIDGDGVGKFDATNEIAMLVGKNGGSSVGSVNVEPELMMTGDFGESDKIVDGAGVGSARGANDAEGLVASSEICADRGFEGSGIELHARVNGDTAESAASESEETNGFVE